MTTRTTRAMPTGMAHEAHKGHEHGGFTMNTTFGDTRVREYDLIDSETLTVAWIGPDGTVEVPVTIADDMAEIAHNAGLYARRGVSPANFDIEWTTFGREGFEHATFAPVGNGHTRTTPQAQVELESIWRMVTDALGAETMVTIVAEIDESAPAKAKRVRKQVLATLANA
jgi:hypothetical protein